MFTLDRWCYQIPSEAKALRLATPKQKGDFPPGGTGWLVLQEHFNRLHPQVVAALPRGPQLVTAAPVLTS